MTRNLVEQEIADTLRTAALSGSDREISLDEPLGELGLGLDSLALIEFVTALEKKFQTQMPNDIWTASGQLTLNHFVEVIAGTNSEAARANASQPVAAAATAADPPSHPLNESSARHRGRTKQLSLAKAHSLFKRLKALYPSRLYHIVQFDLMAQPIPVYSPALKLTLRTASLQDAPSLMDSFPRAVFNKEAMTLELFQNLLETGHICYAAWFDDQIVGYDWVSENGGFFSRHAGLRLDWPKDACYACELEEHDQYRGKGIGLALLAFSLSESKKKGYARQVSWVDARNRAMLSASIQLFNFKITGSVRRRGIVPLSFSTWKSDGRSGHGGTLML